MYSSEGEENILQDRDLELRLVTEAVSIQGGNTLSSPGNTRLAARQGVFLLLREDSLDKRHITPGLRSLSP